MNEETLKYYTALQPLFREKMGRWLTGDRYFIVLDRDSGFVEDSVKDDFNHNRFNAIRLPLTIDDENPERGLLGMFFDFFLIQQGEDGEWSCLFCAKSKRIRTTADTPTLAILKALAEQEGVQV